MSSIVIKCYKTEIFFYLAPQFGGIFSFTAILGGICLLQSIDISKYG